MNDIRIQTRKNKALFFFGIICILMGTGTLISDNWNGWIWILIGILLFILKYFENKNHVTIFNDKGIIQGKKILKWDDIEKLTISADFISIKLKKRKYDILLAWFSDDKLMQDIRDFSVKKHISCNIQNRELYKADNYRKTCLKSYISFGVYSIYFLFLCISIFYFDFKDDFFWFLFGIILILFTVIFIFFIREIASRFHKTLNYKFYQILNNIFFISFLYFSIAVTIRFIYEPAENDPEIRGFVTMMWLSPFLIFNFINIVKNSK